MKKNMRKTHVQGILFLLLLPMFSLKAQTVEEGKSFLYYDRFTSAKNTFNQIISAKPKNTEAIYWLGQTYFRMDSVPAARAVYEKALQAGITDPLIQVGMGHVELMEGKNDQAKQRFEQAIASSKKKKREDPVILTAVGRANADGPSTIGDPTYGIETLKRAAAINPTDPDIHVNMGISYLKLGNDRGGDAYEAFTNALKIDPNYAHAKYRLGRIFLSQNNREKFEGYFIGASESDPKYAPAYLELYNYYALRDVNKAKEYLEKYVANTDKDCQVEFFYADYLFRAGNYRESLEKGKAMENGACKTYPRLKILYAYNYDRLGDSLQAKENIISYLSTAAPDKIQPDDYQLAVAIMKKIPGSEVEAIKYLEIALSKDTVRTNQFVYMDTIASIYRKLGNPTKRLEWLQKSYQTNPQPSDFDIYNMGDAAIDAEQYPLADSMFNLYTSKNPTLVFGYAGLAKSAIAVDKDTTTGSAVPAVMNYITQLETTDKEKYKNTILQNYGYLVYVHANVKKDYAAALKDLEGILAIDPDNAYAKGTSEQIKRILNPPKAAKAPAKKRTGS